jgi:hypothetical protein
MTTVTTYDRRGYPVLPPIPEGCIRLVDNDGLGYPRCYIDLTKPQYQRALQVPGNRLPPMPDFPKTKAQIAYESLADRGLIYDIRR